MKKLSERLIWARERKGLTQASLAKLASVSQSTIGNLEAGLRQTSRNIATLAKTLGVDALWLETGKGSADSASYDIQAVAMPLFKDTQIVVDIMENLDDAGREKIRIAAQEAAHRHRSFLMETQIIHRSHTIKEALDLLNKPLESLNEATHYQLNSKDQKIGKRLKK